MLSWWAPAVILPVALSIDDDAAASSLLFVLSLDVPLTLALAIGVTIDAIRAGANADAERWLGVPAYRPAAVRWLMRLHWLLVMRWPAALALSTALLSRAANVPVAELYLMAVLALAVGMMFLWMRVQGSAVPQHYIVRPRASQGMAALSWAPLHEARDALGTRRMSRLLLPAMLAAPMGALAGDVLVMLLGYSAMVFAVAICNEALRAQSKVQLWLMGTAQSPRRIAYWIWRYLIVGLVAIFVASLLMYVVGPGWEASTG
jgi:hypothetical protein